MKRLLGVLLVSSVLLAACTRPTPIPTPTPVPAPVPTPTPVPAPVLPKPATFTLSSLSVSPSTVGINERVTISVVVSNTGGLSGSYIVTFKINGLQVTTKNVFVAGGASETVSFTRSTDVIGSHAVDVSGLSGTFTVRSPAKFVIPSISVLPGKVQPNEEVIVSATVVNKGDSKGMYNVIFKVDNKEETRKELTLEAGASQNVSYTLKKAVPGTYKVDVNGIVVQFTVTEPPPTPEELRAKQVIKDLAYIKASSLPYSDDADPEYEGISIFVSFYDSKSEFIPFTGVPVNVTVEMYMSTKLIYRKQVVMNSSRGFLEEALRIPFEALPTAGDPYPILAVVVTTPTQGDFVYRGVTFLSSWSRN